MLKKKTLAGIRCAAVVLIVVAMIQGIAWAGPIIVKFAHSESEIDLIQSPYMAYTAVFKNIVESETEGRYEIQIFPSGQMGKLVSMAEQVSRGIIEISGGQNAGMLSTFDPNVQVLEMPYTFQNTEVARKCSMASLAGSFPINYRKAAISRSFHICLRLSGVLSIPKERFTLRLT